MIWSGQLMKYTFWTMLQRDTSWSRSSMGMPPLIRRLRSSIHVSPLQASLNVLIFLLDVAWHLAPGLSVFYLATKASPRSGATDPSPTEMVVAAAKSFLSFSMHGITCPVQGFLGVFHPCQSHFTWNARVNSSKSSAPMPPLVMGEQVLVHLTLHFPPVRFTHPAQRKRLRCLCRTSNDSLGTFGAVRKYTGCEERTAFTSVVLLAIPASPGSQAPSGLIEEGLEVGPAHPTNRQR